MARLRLLIYPYYEVTRGHVLIVVYIKEHVPLIGPIASSSFVKITEMKPTLALIPTTVFALPLSPQAREDHICPGLGLLPLCCAHGRPGLAPLSSRGNGPVPIRMASVLTPDLEPVGVFNTAQELKGLCRSENKIAKCCRTDLVS